MSNVLGKESFSKHNHFVHNFCMTQYYFSLSLYLYIYLQSTPVIKAQLPSSATACYALAVSSDGKVCTDFPSYWMVSLGNDSTPVPFLSH